MGLNREEVLRDLVKQRDFTVLLIQVNVKKEGIVIRTRTLPAVCTSATISWKSTGLWHESRRIRHEQFMTPTSGIMRSSWDRFVMYGRAEDRVSLLTQAAAEATARMISREEKLEKDLAEVKAILGSGPRVSIEEVDE